ncbi:hypothetical protein [Flagellimonas aequoris]|uniref:SGNH/GDSL hydrolase family protein n=1 Tax=Flagellimonas aequoris TaxID=2306997 RepID=A0A418N9M6_9FLAO|nr:hypothetical protein [Allomuricauda aequoris]RIV72570.1 hypothetical protein D2U88_04860 [Allomuricauda aequoris]TXK05070.1 hypothetical protein FQ019_04830 [Allomuricauda aequoris]
MGKAYLNRFFLMAALTIALVYFVGAYKPKPISSTIQKEKFWADKTHSNSKYNVIFIGDSRLYRGIDPRTVSKTLKGLKVLNFGYSSGGHNEVIFNEISQRFVESDKTRAVVLVLSPYSLTPKAQENSHFNQEKERNKKDVFNRRYIAPFFDFFDPVKPSEIFQSNDTIQGYHEIFRPDGWVESYKIPSNPEYALKVYVNDFRDNKVSQDVLDKVYDQVKEWKKQGIQVFAFRMPTTQAMERLEDSISGYKENEIRMNFEKAGGEWINIDDRYGYESYDGSHLERKSAIRFSDYIGNEIQKRMN